MNDRQKQDESERLRDINSRIERLQGDDNARRPGKRPVQGRMAVMAGRAATELVAGVIVGALIGFALDRWLGTSPLFLVVMFFVGAVAGMMNVWRMATGRGMKAGFFDENRRDADNNGKKRKR